MRQHWRKQGRLLYLYSQLAKDCGILDINTAANKREAVNGVNGAPDMIPHG